MEKIHTEIQAAMIRRCVTILKYLKENCREQHLSTKMRVIVKRETTTNGPARYFLKVQLSKMVSGKQSVNPVQKSVRQINGEDFDLWDHPATAEKNHHR